MNECLDSPLSILTHLSNKPIQIGYSHEEWKTPSLNLYWNSSALHTFSKCAFAACGPVIQNCLQRKLGYAIKNWSIQAKLKDLISCQISQDKKYSCHVGIYERDHTKDMLVPVFLDILAISRGYQEPGLGHWYINTNQSPLPIPADPQHESFCERSLWGTCAGSQRARRQCKQYHTFLISMSTAYSLLGWKSGQKPPASISRGTTFPSVAPVIELSCCKGKHLSCLQWRKRKALLGGIWNISQCVIVRTRFNKTKY